MAATEIHPSKGERGQQRREPRRMGGGRSNEILEASVPPPRLAGRGEAGEPVRSLAPANKTPFENNLAECGCHTTVANTQQRSRHSRHLSLPSPRRLWATFTALPPPALSTAGGPLPRRHPGAGFCSAGGETEAEGQGSQGPRAPGLLLQRLCHRLGPLCRAVTPSGASASGRPPTPPPRLPTLCPAGPAHAPSSL